MFGNTTPRGYLVTIAADKIKGDQTTRTLHEIEVVAYDAIEATLSANMKFAAQFGGSKLSASGGEYTAIDVRPSMHMAAADMLAKLFNAKGGA